MMIQVKKTLSNVDNLTENEKKRLQLLTNIQDMIDADYKYVDIATTLGISQRTVVRYKNCNPLERCRLERTSRKKEINRYKEEIKCLIKEGYHASGIAQKMKDRGCHLGKSTIRKYAKIFAEECGNSISKNRKGPRTKNWETFKQITTKSVVIKKQDIVKLIWMNKPLDVLLDNLYEQYPDVRKLKACVDEFRQIFIHRNMPRLYLFIEHYKNSEFAPIASFAKGLERDIDAVENAIASPLSNGFVEGINNRVKMVKRVMYGRCGLELLSAKIMLPYS